jgi:hypothetical protein
LTDGPSHNIDPIIPREAKLDRRVSTARQRQRPPKGQPLVELRLHFARAVAARQSVTILTTHRNGEQSRPLVIAAHELDAHDEPSLSLDEARLGARAQRRASRHPPAMRALDGPGPELVITASEAAASPVILHGDRGRLFVVEPRMVCALSGRRAAVRAQREEQE